MKGKHLLVVSLLMLLAHLVPARASAQSSQEICASPGLPYTTPALFLDSRFGMVISPDAVADGFDQTVVQIYGGTLGGHRISRVQFSVYIEMPPLYPGLLTLPVLTFEAIANGRIVSSFSEPLNPTNFFGPNDSARWGRWEYDMLGSYTTSATEFEVKVTRSVLPPADVLMKLRIINICVTSQNALPTRTPTPTATWTPITLTPTPSLTPTPITYTPTMTPVVISMEDYRIPPLLSNECRDISSPCSLFPTIAFATIALPSPTRRPTLSYSPTPSITPTPTATFTPSNTPTSNPASSPTDCWGYCDSTAVADFGGAVATAGAFRMEIVDVKGTPIGFDTVVRLGALAGSVFAVARGFASTENPASWLIGVLILSVGFTAAVWALVYFVPILLKMAALLMQLLQILLRVVR